MALHRGEELPRAQSGARLARRLCRDSRLRGDAVRAEGGRRLATPLFLVLLMIESTDLVSR